MSRAAKWHPTTLLATITRSDILHTYPGTNAKREYQRWKKGIYGKKMWAVRGMNLVVKLQSWSWLNCGHYRGVMAGFHVHTRPCPYREQHAPLRGREFISLNMNCEVSLSLHWDEIFLRTRDVRFSITLLVRGLRPVNLLIGATLRGFNGGYTILPIPIHSKKNRMSFSLLPN